MRETLSPGELCEWGVYLNGPFSMRGRDALLNGWLVHTVRSIVASKKHRPKFSDSMFPFNKAVEGFFVKNSVTPRVGGVKSGTPRNKGEVAHMTHVWRERFEKAERDYRAGRIPNSHGLYVNERLRG